MEILLPEILPEDKQRKQSRQEGTRPEASERFPGRRGDYNNPHRLCRSSPVLLN